MQQVSCTESDSPFESLDVLGTEEISSSFESYFADHVKPALAELEKYRRELRWEAERPYRYIVGILAAVEGVLCIVDSSLAYAFPSVLAIIFILLIVPDKQGRKGILLSYMEYRLVPYDTKYRAAYRSRVCQIVGRFFGALQYSEDCSQFENLDPLALPSDARTGLYAVLHGTVRGRSYTIGQHSEFETMKRGFLRALFGRSVRYSGLVVALDSPVDSQGVVVICPDRGRIGNWLGSVSYGLERIKLEDPRFEERLEVFGSDQIAARVYLTPTKMEYLDQFLHGLRSREDAAAMQAPILVRKGRQTIIGSVEAGNTFAMGSIYHSAKSTGYSRALFERLRDVFVSLGQADV